MEIFALVQSWIKLYSLKNINFNASEVVEFFGFAFSASPLFYVKFISNKKSFVIRIKKPTS